MVASFKALVKIGVDKVFLHFRSIELVVIHQGDSIPVATLSIDSSVFFNMSR
jgi:hypothetical protein